MEYLRSRLKAVGLCEFPIDWYFFEYGTRLHHAAFCVVKGQLVHLNFTAEGHLCFLQIRSSWLKEMTEVVLGLKPIGHGKWSREDSLQCTTPYDLKLSALQQAPCSHEVGQDSRIITQPVLWEASGSSRLSCCARSPLQCASQDRAASSI